MVWSGSKDQHQEDMYLKETGLSVQTLLTIMGSRPVYMGSQVSRPPHVSKFQHEGKVPTSEPQEIIKVWFISIEVKF